MPLVPGVQASGPDGTPIGDGGGGGGGIGGSGPEATPEMTPASVMMPVVADVWSQHCWVPGAGWYVLHGGGGGGGGGGR